MSRIRTVVVLGVVALIVSSCVTTDSDTGTASADPVPITATSSTSPPETSSPPPTTAPPPTTTLPPTTAIDEVLLLLEGMTLEEKVEQMFVVSISGADATDISSSEMARNAREFGVETPAEIVSEFALGGVIYFGPNLSDPVQIAQLSNGLQQAAEESAGIGLLVAVDQEGGEVRRLGAPVTVFPSAEVFGKINRPDLTERAAEVTALELRAVGVNHVLAPVVDVATAETSGVIGARSFGTNPATVAAMGAATVSGLTRGGVLATAKHFPGHGNTSVDSHTALPIIDSDYTEWSATDRVPYEAVVAAGVPAVMLGHLAFPALDATSVPASLSEPIVSDELRTGLGFEGLIMTDSLRMAGVRDVATDGDIAVLTVEAGADLLLMPQDFRLARQALLDAVALGRISEARIDGSVERILRAKQWLGILEPQLVELASIEGTVGSPAHRAVLDEVIEAANSVISGGDS